MPDRWLYLDHKSAGLMSVRSRAAASTRVLDSKNYSSNFIARLLANFHFRSLFVANGIFAAVFFKIN